MGLFNFFNKPAKKTEPETPRNLDECHKFLDKILTPADRNKVKNNPDYLYSCHHGFGTTIRNKWGLWRDSDLKRWFNTNGIYHADDMSAVIFESYVAYLNGQPYDLKAKAAYYIKFWNESGVDIKKETSNYRAE